MTYWITVAGYLSFVAFGLVLWLYARKHHTKIAKVSELFDRITHHRATRVALVLAWWWIGWHFLVNEVRR